MATRRMITSDIWDDEWFGDLDFFQQSLWIGLFSKCADDQGRMKNNPFLIRSSIFPYKDIPIDEINAAIAKFEADGRIICYEADGKSLIQLVNWWDHQPMQWASYSKLPPPPDWADRIRTKEKGRYVEINWRNSEHNSSPEGSPEHSPEGSPEHSPEDFTRTVQVDGHVPVPVPVPVISSDITAASANLPPDGGGASAPSPTDPPKPDINWPDLNEFAPSGPVPEPAKPKSSRKRSSPPREPPPPAVKIFHDNTQRYPAKALWPDIDTAIGRDPLSLERWTMVIRAWLGMGWKSNNVNGMLDFFRRNEIPPGNGSGKHEHDTRRNATSTGRHTQANWARRDTSHTREDIERILAEREARGGLPEVPGSEIRPPPGKAG